LVTQSEAVALLTEFYLSEGTHAQQYLVTAHGGIDAGADVAQLDGAELQALKSGGAYFNSAVGGHGPLSGSGPKTRPFGQVLTDDHVRSARIEQEGGVLSVNLSGNHVVSRPVATQHDLLNAIDDLALDRAIGVVFVVFPNAKGPGEQREPDNLGCNQHAASGLLAGHLLLCHNCPVVSDSVVVRMSRFFIPAKPGFSRLSAKFF